MKNTWKIALLALLILPWATACNTTRGVGQDIEAAGNAIEEAAEETKEEM